MLMKSVATIILAAIFLWPLWAPGVRSFIAKVVQLRRKERIRPEVDYESVAPEQLPEDACAELARLAPAMVACGFRARAYARSKWEGQRESYSALWINAATGEMACQVLTRSDEEDRPN